MMKNSSIKSKKLSHRNNNLLRVNTWKESFLRYFDLNENLFEEKLWCLKNIIRKIFHERINNKMKEERYKIVENQKRN